MGKKQKKMMGGVEISDDLDEKQKMKIAKMIDAQKKSTRNGRKIGGDPNNIRE